MANMPFVSGKVAQTALQAGLSDDSFGMGYKSQAEKEMQKAQADAKLAELIKGKELEQEAIQNNLALANEEAARQGLKPGKYSIQASQGGIGINPESTDPLASFFKSEQLKNTQEDRLNRGVERFAERLKKNNTPANVAAIQNVEDATTTRDPETGQVTEGGIFTNPDYEVKSVGPNAYLPDSVRGLYLGAKEKLGFAPKGTLAETQAVQRIVNAEIKDKAGSAAAVHEQGRIEYENGLKSGDGAAVKRGLNTMKKAMEADRQNVLASASGDVRKAYEEREGDVRYSWEKEKPVSKKLYSPSRNKTRIMYSDGTYKDVDGKQ